MGRKDCIEWLEKMLGDGELHLVEDVKEAAGIEGFSRAELKDARTRLGVKTFHQFDEDGPTPNWFWYVEERQ